MIEAEIANAEVKRETQVSSELARMDHLLETQEEVIKHLTARIERVLNPSPAKMGVVDDGTEKDLGEYAPLAVQLRNYNERINNQCALLDTLIQRVEI